MTPRRIIPVALLALAGILSLSAALFGGMALVPGARQVHGGVLLLYSVPLILLLPFFCITFWRPRLSVILQLCSAVVFLGGDFFVNMHACGNGHPCPDLIRVAISSFLQPVSLVPFMIAALQTLSIYMREWIEFPQDVHRSSHII